MRLQPTSTMDLRLLFTNDLTLANCCLLPVNEVLTSARKCDLSPKYSDPKKCGEPSAVPPHPSADTVYHKSL